jgi:uncharacterized membrane protein
VTPLILALVLLAGIAGCAVLMAAAGNRREHARDTPQRRARCRFASGQIDFEEYRRRVLEHAAAAELDDPRDG